MSEIIRINGIGSEMQGVGRLSDGRAVFVPGALPGESVKIERTTEKERFCEGRIIDILEGSPRRVKPACPYYEQCGGCRIRHADYAYSLELKKQKVTDAIERIAGIRDALILDTIASDATDRIRNKAEYPVFQRNAGVFVGNSHTVLNVEDCPLQKRESVDALNKLQKLLPIPHLKYLVTRVNREGKIMLVFCVDAPIRSEFSTLAAHFPEAASIYGCHLNRRAAHALDGECFLIRGDKVLCDTINGLTFELAPQAFFQVNPHQAEKLYAKAVEAIGNAENILDAYCGAGTITLSAAKAGHNATGIEIVAPAIANAKHNATLNGLSKQTAFICADAGIEIPKLIRAGKKYDAAILDPPRKGADAALLNALAEAKIPRIAYVSCDPATLARDIKLLSSKGYTLKWAQPVDMFPCTSHVETVVLLCKK